MTLSADGGLNDFDRHSTPLVKRYRRQPYGAFVTHGGGGRAVGSVESVAGSFKLKQVADSVLVKGSPDEAASAQLRALGAALADAAEG